MLLKAVQQYLAFFEIQGRIHVRRISVSGVPQRGGLFYTKSQMKGMSDLMLMLPEGKVLFVELKNQDGGRLSLDQQRFQAECTKLGHIYEIWKSIDHARESMRKHGIEKITYCL